MESFVTIWMEEHAISHFISASLTSPNHVVTVPPCEFGDFLVAERAEAALLFPEIQQFPFPFEVVCHLHIETLFKVGLPLRVIGIGFTLDFDVSFDSDTFCLEQPDGLEYPFLSKDFPMKHPVLPFNGSEVFLLDPFDGLLW